MLTKSYSFKTPLPPYLNPTITKQRWENKERYKGQGIAHQPRCFNGVRKGQHASIEHADGRQDRQARPEEILESHRRHTVPHVGGNKLKNKGGYARGEREGFSLCYQSFLPIRLSAVDAAQCCFIFSAVSGLSSST